MYFFRLRDLLVTSPTAHEPQTNMNTPKKSQIKPDTCVTTPSKSLAVGRQLQYPTTPMRGLSLDRSPQQMTPLKSLRQETSSDPYPVTPPKGFDPLVCPPTPRKPKRKSSLMKIERTARRKRRLLLE